MPASITLAALSYSTPDGHKLFDSLDLTFGPVRTGLVGRNGIGKSTLLRLITGELRPSSGRIAVSGNVSMLRQTVQAPAGATIADALGRRAELDRLARIEAGRGTDADLAEADWTLAARIDAALDRLGIPGLAPGRPLDTLSGGERTRLSLAALMIDEPDFILLDEPTNNLDAEGRKAVAALLEGWRGGTIVVSHDRELLRRMDLIVDLTTLGARAYGGNYDDYAEQKAMELAAAQQALDSAERQVAGIDRHIQSLKERKARRDSAGARKAAKGDMPRILLGAKRDNAEKSSGEAANTASRQREEAARIAADARAQVEVIDPLAIQLPSSGLASGRVVLAATDLTGGPNPDAPVIRNLSILMTGRERVAIKGRNGSGKTTLLRLLTGQLAPLDGAVRLPARHALLDQSVSLLDRAQTIRENFRLLNPGDSENACRSALARFRFRADAALRPVHTLSGGEMLRAGLACTLGGGAPPELLILDEPTNHLDLEAVAAVEAGLNAFDGALLVVSHDRDFLAAIRIEREIELGG